MVAVSNLSKTYKGGVRALRDVTLEIDNGMLGLVGPNGAGKTTLMRILAGLLRPSAGTVRVLGCDLASRRERQAVKALLGYLPQELGLYPDLTGREFLDYIAILKGLADRPARRRQIGDLLEVVGLADAADRRLRTYSGGMKRRLGVAQALLGDPQLLIVDEPTAGLDPQERVRLRNLLADMAGRRTVILSTHIIEDVSQSCTGLVVLNEGRIIFRGTPPGLIDRVRGHVWTMALPGDQRPDRSLVVVSKLRIDEQIEYRILSRTAPHPASQPATPSLEDAYIWLMTEETPG
jgi:ABC-2 type transport system ATP-binding protein